MKVLVLDSKLNRNRIILTDWRFQFKERGYKIKFFSSLDNLARSGKSLNDFDVCLYHGDRTVDARILIKNLEQEGSQLRVIVYGGLALQRERADGPTHFIESPQICYTDFFGMDKEEGLLFRLIEQGWKS